MAQEKVFPAGKPQIHLNHFLIFKELCELACVRQGKIAQGKQIMYKEAAGNFGLEAV